MLRVSTPVADTRIGLQTGLLLCRLNNFQYESTAAQLAEATVLVENRIRAELISGDTVAHADPGVFLIVLERVTDLDHATAIATAIRVSVAQPPQHNHNSVRLTLSIGVTLFGQSEGMDHVIERADLAMNYARRAGGNKVFSIAPLP